MEALEAMPENLAAPPSTRGSSSLLKKGMVSVEQDDYDARIKYVVPTPLAQKYYETLGKFLVKISGV